MYAVHATYEGYALAAYAEAFSDVEPFFGLNVPEGYEEDQAYSYLRGQILPRVEVAIAVSPYTDTVMLRVDPSLNHVAKGSVFVLNVMAASMCTIVFLPLRARPFGKNCWRNTPETF